MIELLLLVLGLLIFIGGLSSASVQDLEEGIVEDETTLFLLRFAAFLVVILALLCQQLAVLGVSLMFGVLFFLVGYLGHALGLAGGADVVVAGSIGLMLGLLSAYGVFPFAEPWMVPVVFMVFLGLVCLPVFVVMIVFQVDRVRFIPVLFVSFVLTVCSLFWFPGGDI